MKKIQLTKVIKKMVNEEMLNEGNKIQEAIELIERVEFALQKGGFTKRGLVGLSNTLTKAIKLLKLYK